MAKSKKSSGPSLGDVAMAMPQMEDRETVRVRKITNGFLICRESYKNGKYKETEVYSPKRPNLNLNLAAVPKK